VAILQLWKAPVAITDDLSPAGVGALATTSASNTDRKAWIVTSSRQGFTDGRAVPIRPQWWAHFEFTRINIGPTFLRKKIEKLREALRGVFRGTP
jgi:hypothetical protein